MGYGSKGLNDLRDEAYECSRAHGFYDDGPPDFGMRLALIHSEISEALEDFRKGYKPNYVWYTRDGKPADGAGYTGAENTYVPNKPCGIPSEMADVIIRVLDFCGANGTDIEGTVRQKMLYNETRPYKHGKKC